MCDGGVSLLSIHLTVNHTIVVQRHTMTLLPIVKLSLRGSVYVHVQGVNVIDITFINRCLTIPNIVAHRVGHQYLNTTNPPTLTSYPKT